MSGTVDAHDRPTAGCRHHHDWEHALGGLHALMWEEAELVGHASLIQRRA